MAATITEDEAALYDRQIRLWGLEAQQKMRNASILVVHLRGVATETIKNIVLSGIGKLTILDDSLVYPEDLGAGFFFRDADVGVKKRVHAAQPHIESLNPLVAVEVLDDMTVFRDDAKLRSLLQTVDLVCLTDANRADAERVNNITRELGKKFYCGGSFGISGYIFCDLLEHSHVAANKTAPKDGQPAKLVQSHTSYVPLSTALKHSWKSTSFNNTKNLRPETVFSILATWEYQSTHGSAPASETAMQEMEDTANRLLQEAEVRPKVIKTVAPEIIRQLATTATNEFSPVCAVVGGMLGQDILKTLAAREPPLANFFVFDGITCSGVTVRMSMEARNEGPPADLEVL